MHIQGGGRAHAASSAERSDADPAAPAPVLVDQGHQDRAPDAAIGWPIPTAPPFTLTMSWEKPSLREQATAIVAKASLISTRSTSDSLSPARASAHGTQIVGHWPDISLLRPVLIPRSGAVAFSWATLWSFT